MSSDIPAEARELGTYTAEYTPSAGRPRQVSTVTTILIFFGAVCVVLGIYWAVPRSDGGMLCVSTFGLIFVGVGVCWYMSNKRQRDMRVLVFPDGLSYTNRGKTEIIRWDVVEAVWQDITEDTTHNVVIHVYTVQCNDGRKFVFKDTLADVDELGRTIQEEVTRRALPRVLEAYNADQTIPFGKLSISNAGMTKGQETLPWDQIERVWLSQGELIVEKVGKRLRWSSFRVLEMPNLFVLLAIVNQIVGINREG